MTFVSITNITRTKINEKHRSNRRG